MHELGHFLPMKNSVIKFLAHGAQWKSEFGKILAGFIAKKIFPADIEHELLLTLKNPAASSCAEASLLRVLRKYDPHKPGVFLLEELPEKSFFRVKNGRVFRKGDRVRKRFLCQDMTTKKMFLFSPVAEVEWVKTE